MSGPWRELRLPADLCRQAEQRFGQRFGTLEELLEFILRELLGDAALQMDQTEQHIVEERLRELGYL